MSLLFLCYVNDMYTSVSVDCKLILSVDDSAILFAHKDPEVISQKVSKVMESCSDWLIDNKFIFTFRKGKVWVFFCLFFFFFWGGGGGGLAENLKRSQISM